MGNLPCLYFTVPIIKLHEALYMLSEVLPSSMEVLLFQAFRVGDQLSEAPGAKVYLIELSELY